MGTGLAGGQGEVADYLADLDRIYAAIERRVGPRPIWDSSKSPVYARRLRQVRPGVQVVGLRRDPRGVYLSWTQPKVRSETSDQRAMPRHGMGGSVARWLYGTLGATLVDPHCVTLSYEQLVASREPQAELARIVERTRSSGDRGWERSDRWEHAIGGNPIRFRSDNLHAVTADDRWRAELGLVSKAAVWLLCVPATKAADLTHRVATLPDRWRPAPAMRVEAGRSASLGATRPGQPRQLGKRRHVDLVRGPGVIDVTATPEPAPLRSRPGDPDTGGGC